MSVPSVVTVWLFANFVKKFFRAMFYQCVPSRANPYTAYLAHIFQLYTAPNSLIMQAVCI